MIVSTQGRSRVSVDTNILVYAVDKSAGDRHRRAQQLIELLLGRDCVLTLQALTEFYYTVTRQGKLARRVARAQVEGWLALFSVVAAQPGTLNRAMAAMESRRLGFWDALLWATVREAGVTLLFSEDFQDGLVMEGVRIANPFSGREPSELLR